MSWDCDAHSLVAVAALRPYCITSPFASSTLLKTLLITYPPWLNNHASHFRRFQSRRAQNIHPIIVRRRPTPLLRAFNIFTHPCQARVFSGREHRMLVYTIRLGVQHLPYSSAARRNIFHWLSKTRTGALTLAFDGAVVTSYSEEGLMATARSQ